MITITIDYNTRKVLAGKLWQYNYGQVLRIQGGNLNKVQEIQFALEETGGDSITRIGVTKDGVTDVVIPDMMLENNDCEVDYLFYVFIYNRDDTSGETVEKFALNVLARSKPEHTGGSDDEDAFGKVIEEVNSAAERAELAEQKSGQHAEQTKADAKQTTADRKEVERLVETVSGIGEQVQAVKEYKDQAQTAATNALLSEQESTEAKEAAIQAQAGAESAADEAEQHALEVAGDKSEVERLAAQVRQDKTAVEQTAQGFESTVSQAVQSMQSAGTQAVGAVDTAKSNAVKAVQTEGATQTGNVKAEGAKQVEAVQAKGREVIDSIPEDFPAQMDTKLDKQQGAEHAGKMLGVGTDGNVTLMGGARVGEVLIADYTHRGNPEFHFSEFDFATGIGTTTEPHGLTTATSVLICPNDFKITNFTKDIVTMPIEWIKMHDQLQLAPVDETHLKVIRKAEQEIILVNLDDVSNKYVDVTKFHFEKAIAYRITNLDSQIKTRYIKVLQMGYCDYVGRYRYRKVNIKTEDEKAYPLPQYINTLGVQYSSNPGSRNGFLQFSEVYVDVRGDKIHYRENLEIGGRRSGYENLVFDRVNLINNYEGYYSIGDLKPDAIVSYENYANEYAYVSNGTRIQIYALEGEYKNES